MSAPTVSPTGQLQDRTIGRIRDSDNNSPSFDVFGVVSGRIEYKPSWKTSWGTIRYNDFEDDEALVSCREIGNELGYATVSGTVIDHYGTTSVSGEIWSV